MVINQLTETRVLTTRITRYLYSSNENQLNDTRMLFEYYNNDFLIEFILKKFKKKLNEIIHSVDVQYYTI